MAQFFCARHILYGGRRAGAIPISIDASVVVRRVIPVPFGASVVVRRVIPVPFGASVVVRRVISVPFRGSVLVRKVFPVPIGGSVLVRKEFLVPIRGSVLVRKDGSPRWTILPGLIVMLRYHFLNTVDIFLTAEAWKNPTAPFEMLPVMAAPGGGKKGIGSIVADSAASTKFLYSSLME